MKRLSILLSSLVLVLLALEAWARVDLGEGFVQGAWVGPPQAICGRFDAQLGWANREGARARIAGRGGRYTVTIDSRGRRGPEREYAKPAGVVRVLLLGDSTGWGWGVNDDEAFARLVEARLGPGVELINLSVPGYSTDQELLALEQEGARYAPDLVLLALVHNDLVANNFDFFQMPKPFFELGPDGALVLTNVPLPPPDPDSYLAASYALRRASEFSALVKRLLPPPPAYQRPDLDAPDVRAAIDRYWDHLADPGSRSSRLLQALKARCDALGAPLVAFVLPHLHDRYLYDPCTPPPAELEQVLAREPARTVLTHGSRRLQEVGARLGFATFSVDRALLDVVRQGVNLDCGDEHLNARGNQVVALQVAASLRAPLAALR